MSDTRDMLVRIKGDTSDFEKSMKRTRTETDSGTTSFLKLSSAVAVGQAAFAAASKIVEKATGFVRDSIEAYKESELVQTQLNTVLESTHHAAGLYIEDLNDQAQALQRMTRYNDEAINGAQGLLLTFTNIKGGVMQEATQAVLDMSTALGQDLKSSSIQLGKALNDPIKGITALSRVGVSFTQSQKDTIAKLVETNKVAEAQQIILKELNTEFGGSAVAAGKTFAGSMDKLKNRLNDVQESIGKVITEGITPFISKAADFVASVDWEKVIVRSKDALKGMWQEMQQVWQSVDKLYQKIEQYLQPKLEALWHTFAEKIVPVLLRLWHEVIEPLLPVIGTTLVIAIGVLIDALNVLWSVLAPIINWMLNNKGVVIAFASAFGILALAMNFGSIVAAFQAAMSAVVASMVATQTSAANLATFLTGTGAGAFGIVAAAAVAAGILIVNAGNQAKAAWGQAQDAIDKASKSDDAVLKNLQNLSKNGTPEQQQRAKSTLKKLAETGGFAEGGYTGAGSKNEIAGVVHKGEYVVPQSQVDQNTGQPKSSGGINITVNMGMYAGMPVEKREIALELWRELTRAARAQGVQLPMIGAVGTQ